jgi:hypothetical protein
MLRHGTVLRIPALPLLCVLSRIFLRSLIRKHTQCFKSQCVSTDYMPRRLKFWSELEALFNCYSTCFSRVKPQVQTQVPPKTNKKKKTVLEIKVVNRS